MKKKILLGSIIAVALLTLVSFSNVVGYNTVKTSQEELIESEYSFDECKEYLFETLVEMSDNPDIKDIFKSNYKPQRIILPFRSRNLDLKVEHLELLYNLSLKIIDKLGEDKIPELMENIEIDYSEFADDLDAIIMGKSELRDRIYTLNKMNNVQAFILGEEDLPIICGILDIILFFCEFFIAITIVIFNILPISVNVRVFFAYFIIIPFMLFMYTPSILLWRGLCS